MVGHVGSVIQRLAVDATGLKVYGEEEWKVKNHETDGRRRVWQKLHIAVDISTQGIIAAELSLSTVKDGEVSTEFTGTNTPKYPRGMW